MNKAIAIDNVGKSMIVPVSKKVIEAAGLNDKKLYAAYFEDGLLIIGDPLDKVTSKVYGHVQKMSYDKGHDKGYMTGYHEGYEEGFHDGKEEAFLRGYRMGYDDAIEGYGYRDFTDCDCGVDCDYDCRNCRFIAKKNKGGY